jgi:hypothetical protein
VLKILRGGGGGGGGAPRLGGVGRTGVGGWGAAAPLSHYLSDNMIFCSFVV